MWISILETVSGGINEREESNKLDFQSFYYSKHFQHSRTCLPYIKSRVTNITTLALKSHKRNVLKPRPAKRAHRNTFTSPATAEVHNPQPTLDAVWNARRTGAAAK
jgi:hypothetical protein